MEKVVSLSEYKENRLQHLKEKATERFRKKLEAIREDLKRKEK